MNLRLATDGPLVAVAAGQTALATNFSVPGNVFLYDVSVPAQPVRVGAVSVTRSVTESGFALRLAMKSGKWCSAFTTPRRQATA
ncbi:MAG: hypothetical protein DMG50_22890 [Acidobacteria bacterium]|nr:MAG: hypothetical protein DMG50_22890 [Acidobacteriota bacterium]